MRLLLTFVLTVVCCAAHAQKLYRCGNQYQDRPCDSPKVEQAAPAAPAVQSPAAPPPPTAEEAANRLKDDAAERARKRKEATCAELAEELESVQAMQRRGATGSSLENLNARIRRIGEDRTKAGC